MRASSAASRRSGLRQLAGRLGETARLTRIELDKWNAGCAERAFDCAMIGPGRFEHDTVQRRLREPFDERWYLAGLRRKDRVRLLQRVTWLSRTTSPVLATSRVSSCAA